MGGLESGVCMRSGCPLGTPFRKLSRLIMWEAGGLILSTTLLETTSRVQSQEQAQSTPSGVTLKQKSNHQNWFCPFPWKGFHKDFRIGIAEEERQSPRFQRENSPSCSLLLGQRGEEVKGR